jgi:two-component system OmpR family response regulator
MKVLVLDDDIRLGELIGRGLRREGHTIDIATTIEDARWLTTESAYDVLVLDVMLGDGDGAELCRDLRARGIWTPVLMLSARDAVVDRVHALDTGADDYLVKPFAFSELVARLRALARRGTTERPTEIVLGELVVEPGARRVMAGQREISLAPREFALLEYLARHVDEVIPRNRLLEALWDWAYEGTPRVIDVYVRALRVKLGSARGLPRLETVRGVGYVLRPPRVAIPARSSA